MKHERKRNEERGRGARNKIGRGKEWYWRGNEKTGGRGTKQEGERNKTGGMRNEV